MVKFIKDDNTKLKRRMNMRELEFVLKVENVLGDLEVELREMYDSHEDIYSNEHVQMRDLLKVLRATRKEVSEVGAKLMPPDEFTI